MSSPLWITIALIAAVILAIGCWDRIQTREPTYRIYPIFGRLLRALRQLRAALYLPTSSEGPFSVEDLKLIRYRALTGSNYSSFGTTREMTREGFRPAVDIAVIPSRPSFVFDLEVGGTLGDHRIRIPLLNFGALGFGPVNENVIRAFGNAAAEVGCVQNTGEDGLTSFHLESGAALLWQISTGYWGCRDNDGHFADSEFQRTVRSKNVVMLEVKLSQGAKPGVGGMMPAVKNSSRVARILGVQPHIDIVSPPQHSAFSNISELLLFLKKLGQLSGGMPVGIKLCVGSESSFRVLVDGMCREGIIPDFITIDGAEGGTGAGPTVLQDHAGLPAREAVQQVDLVLRQFSLRDRTRLFAAGAIKTGFDLFELLALGADGCFFTRAPMVAIGCVQARECHLGTCPAGITTQDWWRRNAINPDAQGKQLVRYYNTVKDDLQELMMAAGLDGPKDIKRESLL